MKPRHAFLLLVLLLVTACYTGRRQQMLSLLDQADSLNRAYAQLPPDSLLQEAARFFDRHGTPDEQVRAYYLLGSAYRDQGQAPEALQAWHDALDRADTIHGDKQRLMAVYGQMAELYDNQGLASDELAAMERYGRYALAAKDTFKYIRIEELKSKVFDLLGDTIRMLDQIKMAQRLYERHGYHKEAVQASITPIYIAIERNELDSACQKLRFFESESGLFDNAGNISQGREVYYYIKGVYFLKCDSLKQADFLARKLLDNGMEVNAYRLLLDIYTKKDQIDSVRYFAHHFEKAVDAENIVSTRSIVHKITALYNYQKSENRAKEKTIEALRFKALASFVSLLAILLLVMMVIVYARFRTRQEKAFEQYLRNVEQLREARQDVRILRSHEIEYRQAISDKEKMLELLENQVKEYQQASIPLPVSSSDCLEKTEIYRHIHVLANKGIKPTSSDMQTLHDALQSYHPRFCDFLALHKVNLKEFEYNVCMLIHIQIKPTPISRMYDVSGPYLSLVRKDLLKKMFNSVGKPAEFDIKIRKT